MAILLIDDDHALREVTRDLLEIAGHVVFDAADATGGLEIARREALAAILLDVRLPSTDLLDLIGSLRAAAPRVPVVLHTGVDREDIEPALLALPAVGYAQKPVRANGLEAELQRLRRPLSSDQA